MKTEFEEHDIERIVEKVLDRLKPLLVERSTSVDGVIFDVEGLAEYLEVKTSWVYKKVSLNAIPFHKVGKYDRFKKVDIDKWLSSQGLRPLPTNIRKLKKIGAG